MAALTGMISNPINPKDVDGSHIAKTPKVLASASYLIADAMMEARKR